MRKSPHEEYRQAVVELATLHGWKCAWVWKSYHSPKGFQDLVLAHRQAGKLWFVELKAGKDIVQPEQQEWHDTIKAIARHPLCEVDAAIWRRELNTIDKLEEVLR